MNRRDLFKMAALLPFAIPAISVKATAPEPKPEPPKPKHSGGLTVIMGREDGAKKLLAEHIRSNLSGALAVFHLSDAQASGYWMKEIDNELSGGRHVLVVVPHNRAKSVLLMHKMRNISTSMPTLVARATWVIELCGYDCTIADPTPSHMSWTCRTVRDRYGIYRESWTWDSSQPWRVFWQLPLKERWTMSVQHAREAKVCRVCQADNLPRPGNSLVLNYGEEYGHERCLSDFDMLRPPTQLHRMD